MSEFKKEYIVNPTDLRKPKWERPLKNTANKMQNKRTSLLEAIINTIIGMVISFILQVIVYKSMSIPVRFSQNIIITLVFTAASILRGYVVRRFFNKKEGK